MSFDNKNISKGSRGLNNLTTGTNNVGIGHNTLLYLTAGSYNSAIGSDAETYSIIGSNNTSIGYNSAYNFIAGSRNTFLGTNTHFDSSTKTYSNSTAVGYNAVINDSNQIVLGTSSDTVYVPSKLGINIKNSSYFLDVNGTAQLSSYNTDSINILGNLTINTDSNIYASKVTINNNNTLEVKKKIVADIDLSGSLTVPNGKLYNYPGGMTIDDYSTTMNIPDGLPSFYIVDISCSSVANIILPNATTETVGQILVVSNFKSILDHTVSVQGSNIIRPININTSITSSSTTKINMINYGSNMFQCIKENVWLQLF